jgi:hypothetical protein
MAEFQWWLLLVGLVAGGGLVAVVSMDSRRREQDIGELEQRAEATWIADQLAGRHGPDAADVEAVLRAHREYLSLQPPDRLIVEQDDDPGAYAFDQLGRNRLDAAGLDGDPDREPDHIGDDGRGGSDQDLARPAEQQASTRQEAHAGADREQGGER